MLFDILTGKGLFQLEWWAYILLTLGLTHITIASVTLYLHRCQAHRSVDFHPALTHFMRFWLWLTTGLVTREWVAVHRKHHAKVETPDDPHSPVFYGIEAVLYRGAELYRDEASKQETLALYSHQSLPKDRLEKKVYSAHPSMGIALLFITQLVLFGFFGIVIWAIQMAWIPFFAAGVINGLGHYTGYRNFECNDNSTNILSLGLLVGGEELHNNHHAYPSSAKLSSKWWEFDIGWGYIKVLSFLRLANVLRLAPMPKRKHDNIGTPTPDTLRSLIQGRPHVLREYAMNVLKPVFKAEYLTGNNKHQRKRQWVNRVNNALFRHKRHTTEHDLSALKEAVLASAQLKVVCEFKQRLEDLLHSCCDQHTLLDSLQEWCYQAERSGIQVLSNFAQRIRSYSLHTHRIIRVPAIS